MEKLYTNNYTDFYAMLEAGESYKGITLTREMVTDKLLPASTAVQELFHEYGMLQDDALLEQFVIIDDDMAGSIDMLARSEDGKTVLVLDYKFGYVTVAAKDNAQLLFYALAAATDPNTCDWFDNVENVVLAIIQPNDQGSVTDTWTVDMHVVDDFESVYFNAVELTEDFDQQPASGKHCKFCPVAPICPAKTGEAVKASRISEITAAKLAEYLPLAEQVEAWAKEVKKFAHAQMELGVNVQGYKIVNKRATRKWLNTAAVETKVRKARKISIAEGFNRVLKSPPQLEKLCYEKGIDFNLTFGDYVSSVSSGTTLATADDKRPAALALAGLEQLNALNL
jgi:CRISPR/Cas system-associated exonuclease Cas4 (RecB family)